MTRLRVQRSCLLLILLLNGALLAHHRGWGVLDSLPSIPGEYPAVMIVEETSDQARLTYESLTSPVVLDAMDKGCAKIGNTPLWKKWDKDLTDEALKQAPEQLRLMFAQAKADSKGQVPWVLASGKHKSISAPWPKTDHEALALLKKAGIE